MNKRLTDEERGEIREAVRNGTIVQEDPDISRMVTRMEAEADAEIAGTVTLRWGREQIDVVKRAAAILGVPYQTYLKQVVFNHAIDDIARAEAVLGRKKQPQAKAQPPGKRRPVAR